MKRIQDRKSFAEILDSFGEEPLRRVLEKVPGWKGVEGLKVPSLLNAEQCSSAQTALYKASLASRIAGPAARVADLTGGLGVDSYFLSRVASEVLYLERDPRLCEAAGSNFALLGTCNIKILNTTCGPDTGTKKHVYD